MGLQEHIDHAKRAKPTWNPETGGTRAWVCFEDHVVEDVGPDPDGSVFAALADRMMRGDYYPPDVIIFFGEFRSDGRDMRPGDRVVQQARLISFLYWPILWSVAEIYVAERTADTCTTGYVTTDQHFGRGIWRAVLSRKDGRLTLDVKSTASPGSFWFWVGLPVARYLQLRARRRAIEDFRREVNGLARGA
ncbi:MAG: DUF1990 family protein [Armatimonadetes bacterium]|nr:DUF1990 family protein [Armatimonadota bacterium]